MDTWKAADPAMSFPSLPGCLARERALPTPARSLTPLKTLVVDAPVRSSNTAQFASRSSPLKKIEGQGNNTGSMVRRGGVAQILPCLVDGECGLGGQ